MVKQHQKTFQIWHFGLSMFEPKTWKQHETTIFYSISSSRPPSFSARAATLMESPRIFGAADRSGAQLLRDPGPSHIRPTLPPYKALSFDASSMVGVFLTFDSLAIDLSYVLNSIDMI